MKRLLLFLPLLFAPLAAARAHNGVVDVTPANLWSHWEVHLLTAVSVLLVGGLYARGLMKHPRMVKGWQVMAFTGGVLALFVALLSPLDALSEALFSAHMVQHLILVVVAAPLLALSQPLAPLLWGLPEVGRHGFVRLRRQRSLRAFSRFIMQPFVALILHLGAIWVWHLPALYEAALQHEIIHLLEHATFFGTALLYWWVVLEPARYGENILSVFGMAMGSAALGVLMTFTPAPWYATHAAYTDTWGLTALEDQRLAGVIMWLPAGVVYVVAGAALLGLWIEDSERREARRIAQAVKEAHRA